MKRLREYKKILKRIIALNECTHMQYCRLRQLINIDIFNWLIRKKPDPNGWIYFEIGNFYSPESSTIKDISLKYYLDGAKSNNVYCFGKLANHYFVCSVYDKAKFYAQKSMTTSIGKHVMAYIHLYEKKYQEALSIFCEIDEFKIPEYYNIAICHLKLNDIENYLLYIEVCIKTDHKKNASISSLAGCVSDNEFPKNYLEKVIEILQEHKSNIDAKYGLAIAYMLGKGLKQDTGIGMWMIMENCQLKHNKSMTFYVECYLSNLSKSYFAKEHVLHSFFNGYTQKLFKILTDLESNNVSATKIYLAIFYLYGIGTEVNKEKAIELFKQHLRHFPNSIASYYLSKNQTNKRKTFEYLSDAVNSDFKEAKEELPKLLSENPDITLEIHQENKKLKQEIIELKVLHSQSVTSVLQKCLGDYISN